MKLVFDFIETITSQHLFLLHHMIKQFIPSDFQ